MIQNHAFLLMVHNNYEFVEKLIVRLSSPNHYFFINIDQKNKRFFPIAWMQKIEAAHNAIFLNPGITVNHGGYSFTLCTIALLKEAYNYKKIKIDYFHNLSGQDYPCVSNKEFDSFFSNTTRSYMKFDSEEKMEDWQKTKYSIRVNNYYLQDLNFLPFLNYQRRKKINRILETLLNKSKIVKRKKYDQTIYAGWNWFTWHRNVVEYVINYLHFNQDYLHRFKWTDCADELIFHTLLYKRCEELNIEKENSLRFIEWEPKRSVTTFPLVLEETEYEDIIKSKAFFCRKIDITKSKKLVELLDKKVSL